MKKLIDSIVIIIKIIIQKIYQLFGKELKDEQWQVWMQFIGFAVVGVSNFLVSYGTYAIFISFHCSFHVSNIASFLTSVFNAFYWNNRYVFKKGEGKERVWWKTLVRTYISYAFTGLFLTEILLSIEINLLGLHKMLGPVINLFITTPLNFFINKFWTFKERTII